MSSNPTEHDERIEVVARTLFDDQYPNPKKTWDERDDSQRSAHRETAKTILAALDAYDQEQPSLPVKGRDAEDDREWPVYIDKDGNLEEVWEGGVLTANNIVVLKSSRDARDREIEKLRAEVARQLWGIRFSSGLRRDLITQTECAEEQVKKFREALEFYANRRRYYHNVPIDVVGVLDDSGKTARTALNNGDSK